MVPTAVSRFSSSGSAIRDLEYPDRVLVGGYEKRADGQWAMQVYKRVFFDFRALTPVVFVEISRYLFALGFTRENFFNQCLVC